MANSTSQAVATAAAAVVTAVGLTNNAAAVPVAIRKTPSVPEGASQSPVLPQLVVSVGEEGKTEYLTATLKLKTYPVAVTIVTNTGLQLADNNTVRQWREQIELALEHTANWQAGGTGALAGGQIVAFNQVDLTNKPPFDAAALAKDYNYAIVVAEIQVVELRG